MRRKPESQWGSWIVALCVAALILAILAAIAHSEPQAEEPRAMLVFGAEWCPACKAMEPDVNALAREQWTIYRVDVDKQPGWAKWAGIGPGQSIPLTVIATRRWKRLASVDGLQSKNQLLALLRGWNIERRPKN